MSNSPRFYKPADKNRRETAENAQLFLDTIATTGVENNIPPAIIRRLQRIAVQAIREHAGYANVIVRLR